MVDFYSSHKTSQTDQGVLAYSEARALPGNGHPFQMAGLLGLMVERGATDLFLSPGRPPEFRLSDQLVPLHDQPVLSADDTQRLALDLLTPKQQERFKRYRDVDFSFELSELARFRCSLYLQRGVISLAVRALPLTIPSLESLGLPPVVAELAFRPRGLVLVTGPTGSGKSTTLAAIIDLINQTRQRHIITIEDPIEYRHTNKQSLVEQREVGADTPSFTRALRSVFRQSPDVILVGEMRDQETIKTVLTLAETGHLTFATLHTNSCSQAVHRIIDAFPLGEREQVRAQLALSLEGVITQALLPRVGGGLALAVEIMVATPAVRTMIREGRAHELHTTMQAGQQFGMRTMSQSLADLVARGLITQEEALARSADHKELQAEILRREEPAREIRPMGGQPGELRNSSASAGAEPAPGTRTAGRSEQRAISPSGNGNQPQPTKKRPMRFRSLLLWGLGCALLGFGAYMGGFAAANYFQVVDLVEGAVEQSAKWAMSAPPGFDHAEYVGSLIGREALRRDLPLDERKVFRAGKTLRVNLKWSYPLITAGDKIALGIPLALDRSFDLTP
jgi:twitching motility protein PilT